MLGLGKTDGCNYIVMYCIYGTNRGLLSGPHTLYLMLAPSFIMLYFLIFKYKTMKRTQWVVTMHFDRGNSQVWKFDSNAAALNCIRATVFSNEDCINFSCYREEVKNSSIEDKLDTIQKMMERTDAIINKM